MSVIDWNLKMILPTKEHGKKKEKWSQAHSFPDGRKLFCLEKDWDLRDQSMYVCMYLPTYLYIYIYILLREYTLPIVNYKQKIEKIFKI